MSLRHRHCHLHRHRTIGSPLRCLPEASRPLRGSRGQMHSPGWRAWPGQITPCIGPHPPPPQQRPQIEPPPPPTPHCSREAASWESKGLGPRGAATHPRARTGARSTAGQPWELLGRGLQVNALSWEHWFFQSLVHSRLAPGGGSSEGTSAPRPSSAGERVTSGSRREPLSKNPQCWRPGVAMETGIGACPHPTPIPTPNS